MKHRQLLNLLNSLPGNNLVLLSTFQSLVNNSFFLLSLHLPALSETDEQLKLDDSFLHDLFSTCENGGASKGLLSHLQVLAAAQDRLLVGLVVDDLYSFANEEVDCQGVDCLAVPYYSRFVVG